MEWNLFADVKISQSALISLSVRMCCLNNCFLLTKYHNDSKMEETVQNTTVTNLVKCVSVSIWKKNNMLRLQS